MYEVCLSSRDRGILTLLCDSRRAVTEFLSLALNYSLEFSVKEVKDAEPDT